MLLVQTSAWTVPQATTVQTEKYHYDVPEGDTVLEIQQLINPCVQLERTILILVSVNLSIASVP